MSESKVSVLGNTDYLVITKSCKYKFTKIDWKEGFEILSLIFKFYEDY